MDQIIYSILLYWGPLGLLLIVAGWIIYKHLSFDYNIEKHINSGDKNTILLAISDKIDLVNLKIEMVNNRVDDINIRFEERSDDLERLIGMLSTKFIKDIEKLELKKREEHSKLMNDLLILGPKLHKILADYIYKINVDHIFLGSFHNGSNSISGIPYYKCDIIAEKFILQDDPQKNKELALMYKDVDILRHNKLPLFMILNKLVYFNVSTYDKLNNIDNILYNKIINSGIRLIAINVLFDQNGSPSGFVGCLKYNDDKINLDKLSICAETLESIYRINQDK